MNAQQLWQDLKARGFRLAVAPSGCLVVDYPEGAMDDSTRTLIHQHKPALLVLLGSFAENPTLTDPGKLLPTVATGVAGDTEPPAPVAPPPDLPETLASDEDLARIRSWLAAIGEEDEVIIAEVLNRCRQDPEALCYYLRRSAEVPGRLVGLADDRIICRTCTNLHASGRCLAAARGEILGAAERYSPPPDRQQRCEGYQPKPDQADRRPGRERWPFLIG